MAEDSFILSLQGEWGDPRNLGSPDLTIKSVAAQVVRWLQDPNAEPAPLLASLAMMKEKVAAAEASLQHDLDTRILENELRGWLEASLQEYQDLGYYLGQLSEGITEKNSARVQDDLLQLKGASRSLTDQQQSIERWLNAGVLRCPRCGSPEHQGKQILCATCDLELLYPDPSGGTGPSRSVTLGAEYKQVNDAYLAVVKGERPLSTLKAPLEQLRRLLERYAHLAEREKTSREGLRQALDQVAASARSSLQGLGQMSDAQQTRRVSDLHQGWQVIFEEALELQEQLASLAHAAGKGSVKADSGGFPPIEDGVFLQGDDE